MPPLLPTVKSIRPSIPSRSPIQQSTSSTCTEPSCRKWAFTRSVKNLVLMNISTHGRGQIFIDHRTMDRTGFLRDLVIMPKLPFSSKRTTTYLPQPAVVLHQNFPNPFNSGTTITFQLPRNGHVQLHVYDILGKEIAPLVDEIQPEGTYSVGFDGSLAPSGVYIYSLKVNNHVRNRKHVLLK